MPQSRTVVFAAWEVRVENGSSVLMTRDMIPLLASLVDAEKKRCAQVEVMGEHGDCTQVEHVSDAFLWEAVKRKLNCSLYHQL